MKPYEKYPSRTLFFIKKNCWIFLCEKISKKEKKFSYVEILQKNKIKLLWLEITEKEKERIFCDEKKCKKMVDNSAIVKKNRFFEERLE